MNISSRFTEFGMTGAFFWVGHIIFFSLGYRQGLVDIIPQWVMVWDGYQAMLPKVLQEAAGSLVTVFGVISIFITGLILDLMGSYFAPLEQTIFNRHLARNQDWLNNLTDQCPESLKQDYRTLRDLFETKFIVPPKKVLERFGMTRQCKHMQSFLFSYIHVFSSLSEILVDNMHLWRTSRAVSTTLLILAIEVIVLNFQRNLSDWAYMVGLITCFGLSAFITVRAYSRLCFTLFSLACATREKPRKDS